MDYFLCICVCQKQEIPACCKSLFLSLTNKNIIFMCSHSDSISLLHRISRFHVQFLPCFFTILSSLVFFFFQKCDGKNSFWKICMKNIKYDHIDKNKIINLCQFLVVAAAVQNNIIIEKEKLNKEKVFPHNQSVCIYKNF